MSRSPLSNQRQLVELLDPEPLFGYLLQNGALNEKDVELFKSESSQAKANLAFLRCIESNGQHAHNLLVNALRQTGQLHLASLLDESGRIKTFTGSGYLSKKRHRGQLSLRIEIKALKIDQDSVLNIINPVNKSSVTREWVSAEDICHRISVLSESQTKLSSSFHIVETPEASSPKKQSCLCACFASLFSRKKDNQATKGKAYLVAETNGNNVTNRLSHTPSIGSTNDKRGSSPNHYISTTHITSNTTKPLHKSQEIAPLSSTRFSRTSIDNLRSLLDMFHQKATEVYTVLQDSQTKTREGLIKYFEQNRGVLVLHTEIQDIFVVNNICTTVHQAEKLRRDLQSGQLSKDVENRIVTDEVLQKTGLLGIRLKATFSQDELDLVEQELTTT